LDVKFGVVDVNDGVNNVNDGVFDCFYGFFWMNIIFICFLMKTNLFPALNCVRDSSGKPTERRHDERGLAADSPTRSLRRGTPNLFF
jgi:hypothetical protein